MIIPESTVNGDTLIKAISTENLPGIDMCLQELSGLEADTLSGIGFIRNSADYYSRMLGVQFLASYLRDGGDLITAMDVAKAAFAALEDDPNVHSGERPEVSHMAANILDVLVTGLPMIGNAKEVTNEADHWAEWVIRINRQEYFLPRIRISQIEALIIAGEYDRARELLWGLKDVVLPPSLLPEVERLSSRMPVLLRAVDEPEPPPIDSEKIMALSLEAMNNILTEAAPEPRHEQAQDYDPSASLTSDDIAHLMKSYGLAQEPASLDDIISRAARLPEARNPYPALVGVFDGLSVVFADEQSGKDPAALEKLVGAFHATAEYARHCGFWEDEVLSRWLLAIACKRLARYNEAARILRSIREGVDAKRLSVADPRNRAGISVYVKHLYAVSAEVLFELGDEFREELFLVIESSKSKILGEMAALKRNVHDDTEPAGQNTETGLPGLRRLLSNSRHRACYLTLLSDSDCLYAVLVDRKGGLHSGRIGISKNAVNQAALKVSELCNGSTRNLSLCSPIDPNNPWKRPFAPALTTLSPLAGWLSPFVADAELLYVNLDGALYNVPFHMLDMDGEPLIGKVGVCVTSSSDLLVLNAQRQREVPYRAAASFIVPRSCKDESGQQEQKQFQHLADTLGHHVPTKKFENGSADLKGLLTEDLKGKVILFAAHGEFRKDNPLGSSGIYLALEGQLPGDCSDKGKHLLSPGAFSQLDMDLSHVTLLACVSGETVEITSREALGMIWASFQAGCTSMLAAGWRVNLNSAAELVGEMYRLWLGEKLPLWKAHQVAITSFKQKNESYAHPFHWAPFVLYGYPE